MSLLGAICLLGAALLAAMAWGLFLHWLAFPGQHRKRTRGA
jgi:hypothetical protein